MIIELRFVKIPALTITGLALLLGSSCVSNKSEDENIPHESLVKLTSDLQSIREEQNTELVKKISTILDKINSSELASDISYANTSLTVASILLNKEETKFLIANSSVSLPLMYERLVTQKGIDYDETLIIYFLVFQEAKNAESIPYLINYLSDLQRKGTYRLYSQSHPHSYAVSAILNIIGEKTNPYYYYTVDWPRDLELIREAKKWYDDYEWRNSKDVKRIFVLPANSRKEKPPQPKVTIQEISDGGFIMPNLVGLKTVDTQDVIFQMVVKFACPVYLKSGYGEGHGGTILSQKPSPNTPVKYHQTIEIEIANEIECAR